MELPRRRMYGCEEEDAMTLFRAGAGQQADDDVLNLYGYGNGTAAVPSLRHHLCHEHQQPRSSRHSSHVDAATDDDEIEQAVELRHRRRRRQQQQGVADDAAATDAVLVARDNQEVSRLNAEAAQRNAEAAREHEEVAMASAAAPRVAGVDDARPRRQRQRHENEIAHLMAEGVAELARLRAEMARRTDEAAAGIITSFFAAALLAPLLMAALLYHILPLNYSD